MNKSDCFHLGYVLKPHSFSGEVAAKVDVDNINNYKKLESVFVELNNELVPFFILQITTQNKDTLIIKFDGHNTIESAEELQGAQLYLPLSFLPPLPPGRFYNHEVVGYTVIDKVHGNIGIVQEVLNMPLQDILSVKNGYKEILIPIVDSIVTEVNKTDKIINTTTPEGLVELYMNEKEVE